MKFNNLSINSIAALLTFSLIFFSACDDDESADIDQANLVGDTWVYDHADAGDDFSNALIDAFLEGSEYTFNSDKTYTSVQLGFESTGDWSYSDDNITLDAGGEFEQLWKVKELSDNTLHYDLTTIDDESGDESTVSYVYKR